MSHIKMLALVALAVCCLGMTSAATAFAEEGQFINVEGKALAKSKFTGSSGTAKFETTGKLSMTCTSDTVTGKMTATTAGEETVSFSGCESVGKKCTSAGASSGTVRIPVALRTRVASQPSGEVLLLAQVLQNSGKEAATESKPFEFKCGEVVAKLYGSYLVKTGEQEAFKESWTFTAEQESGKQKPAEYESEKKEKVKDTLRLALGGGYEQAGLSDKEELAFEEKGLFVQDRTIVFGSKIEFGQVKKGISREITVTDTFNVEAQTGVLKLSGTAFKLENNLCNNKLIAAAGNCKYGVLFSPAVEGLKPAEALTFPWEETGGAKTKFLEIRVVTGESIA